MIGMVDTVSQEKRSEIMSKIRGRDTTPEMLVRRVAHGLGYRFRLHRKGLPGSPDLVFPRFKKVLFVNGCFWHRHTCRVGKKAPKSNAAYWDAKWRKNRDRDTRVQGELRQLGWEVLVVWECQCADWETVAAALRSFLQERTNPPRARPHRVASERSVRGSKGSSRAGW